MNAREQSKRSFGEWLRQRRRELDLTREELARQVGCSAVTLRKLETEERRPSKPMAERLADVLQVAPVDRPAFLRYARGDPFAAPAESKSPELAEKRQTPRHNLPLQLTSFVGREKEIVEVSRLLAATRLVTLTGVGGTGKTRLSLHVAAGLLDAFPDGVWLVELAPLADTTLVPQAVADALGIKEQAGRPILAALTDHLRGTATLLVLDNCEHLITACAQFAANILQSCPDLRLLATSREGLDIPGEMLFVVPALSSPNTRDLPALEALIHYEAVRLFVERAGAALPGFALTPDNAPAVARVCQQLEGIPLAIELAAARVRVLRVEEIAARLNDRFRLLTGGSRAALPRHQTLQALIDWSYDLLPAAEQVLLRRLAVFVGGWTLEAAEAACAGEGVDTSDVLELLTRLVNKSLVAVERQPGRAARYRLLETIRQYALAKLTASGETDAVWQRLTAYYIELAKTPVSTDPMPADLDRAHRLGPERDNLRAALAWTQSATGSAELGLRLAGAVMVIWIGRGYWSEARGFLEDALAVAGAEGTNYAQARARVLYGLGYITAFQGDHALGETHLVQSLRLARDISDRPVIGWTLAQLAELAIERGDAATARLQLDESLALFRDLGITEGVAWALLGLGAVAVIQEDAGRATALLEEALVLYRTHEEPGDMGVALNRLGHVAQLQGDFERAKRLHEASLAWFREYGEPNFIGPLAFLGLGETALAQGDASLATTHFTTALAMWRERGAPAGTAWCLAGLAGAAALDGEPERAAWLWGAAEALRLSIGARPAPATRATRERLMGVAREQLGEEAFDRAWAEGQVMTMEQAVAEALNIASQAGAERQD